MNMNNIGNMAQMNAMGGPVGGAPMPMMNNGTMPARPQQPPQPQQQQQQQQPQQMQFGAGSIDGGRSLLETYIYDYFLRQGMYDCARTMLQTNPQIKTDKSGSPGQNLNGLGDDPMDTDSKDNLDQKRPEDLPPAAIPNSSTSNNSFLLDWFSLFWDMFNSQKSKGPLIVNQYVQHNQTQARMRQEHMLRQMRPEYAQAQYQQQMMRNMNGMGGMMKPGNQLQRAALANSQNPQAMQMLQAQKAAQMQRDPSDMDGNRVRAASPGSADNAPSPSKRPRLEGAPFNPNAGVIVQNGRQMQGMPGQQQHHGKQMPTNPMANAGGPQNQGSPMLPQGPDGQNISHFYNQEMGGGNGMRAGPGNGQNGSSNHALQDYQMQLMLLEQQNKKRLMMARQEQDGMPRPEGPNVPGGPGGPGGPQGPNPQGFQGNSPPGQRNGASPNPSEQMKRANQQMNNPQNMGSPLPDGAQNRGSPNPMNFMGGNMDPNGGQPHYGMNMNMGNQMGGGMRPPSSHPGQPFNGQMNPQMVAAQQQRQAQMQQQAQQQAQQQQQQAQQAQQQQAAQQQQNQGAPNMQWQQPGPNGQMVGQPPQGQQPQGAAQQRAMPPPSAPPTAAAMTNAANSRNATSSPQVANAAPPTPNQGNKPAPKKKETKNAKNKAATQKKSNQNLNAGATPAADADQPQEPPAPATPITPVNPASFGKNQVGNQVVQNGQPAAPVPPPSVPQVAAPPHPDPAQNNFNEPMMNFDVEFANPLTSNDVLNDFDFDSFLHDNDNGGEPFDFNAGVFLDGGEIGSTE
ncbi:unnamed protein product [Sordaria macrospora k-hell]|uniref:WGS project CABT00000000 data, contig 2.31 n=1 Tax=Sordaria macrospora (strain ATCC MYA-333 / DSM 997 / K(L3346) / K-hell) TaxID=771870 RepID=F7W5M2_SORMK|nr:uncharacterized protein SMAC_07653 [Sordaria macrospora k-hell]CCC12810.1 unnamed protein product [Sordaria macrospora k-hell]